MGLRGVGGPGERLTGHLSFRCPANRVRALRANQRSRWRTAWSRRRRSPPRQATEKTGAPIHPGAFASPIGAREGTAMGRTTTTAGSATIAAKTASVNTRAAANRCLASSAALPSAPTRTPVMGQKKRTPSFRCPVGVMNPLLLSQAPNQPSARIPVPAIRTIPANTMTALRRITIRPEFIPALGLPTSMTTPGTELASYPAAVVMMPLESCSRRTRRPAPSAMYSLSPGAIPIPYGS